MRTSSEKRSIGKYRPESVRPDTGYGYGSGSGRRVTEEQPPLTERRAREFEFVRTHLPDEHEGMAVSALISLQMAGRKPTKQQILNRLHAQGRTAEQLRAKGWME